MTVIKRFHCIIKLNQLYLAVVVVVVVVVAVVAEPAVAVHSSVP